jgi:hypothetical protein
MSAAHPRSEYDAAYFTMLRAVEERDRLLRYGEYLQAELAELDDFAAGLAERAEQADPRVRRPVDRTAKPLLEAVGRRRAVVLDELDRMGDRITGAEAFVDECEREVAALRS